MAIKLDPKKIEDSYGQIQGALNAGVIDAVNELASAIMPEVGSNTLADELVENCKAVQTQYNEEFYPAIKNTLDSFQGTFDIAEYLAKKASVGEISKQSVGYKNSEIDPSAVVM